MTTRLGLGLVLLPTLFACSSAPAGGGDSAVEARSLDGRDLLRQPMEPAKQAEYERGLDDALAALEAHPDDPAPRILVGRRLSQLGRYREALATFQEGARKFPDDARFARFAGHRMITLRRFAEAERELERAESLQAGREDELEESLSSDNDIDWLAHSIQYHLGLARYFQGDWRGASDAFGTCLAVSRNDDARCSAAYWLVVALRRQGRDDAARAALAEVSGALEVREYVSYRDLVLFYTGQIDQAALLAPGREQGGVEFATRAYGAAQWQRFEGRAADCEVLLHEIVAAGMWPAFGAIGAEVDLARR